MLLLFITIFPFSLLYHALFLSIHISICSSLDLMNKIFDWIDTAFILSFHLPLSIKKKKKVLPWEISRLIAARYLNSFQDKLMIVTVLIRYKSWQSQISSFFISTSVFVSFSFFFLLLLFHIMHINYVKFIFYLHSKHTGREEVIFYLLNFSS